MKKVGVLLGVVALLNLVYAAGAFAADRDLLALDEGHYVHGC